MKSGPVTLTACSSIDVRNLTSIKVCQHVDMSQPGIDLETSLGYLLKEAASALRFAMEEVLKPLGMTVTITPASSCWPSDLRCPTQNSRAEPSSQDSR